MSHDGPAPWDPSGPPALVVDSNGVAAWLGGVLTYQIRWDQIEEVTIGVLAVPEVEYPEAFWSVTGKGMSFGAPVELVVNSEDLNRRLFVLPGFDMIEYRRARDAESRGQPGDFVCWRRRSA